MKGSHYQGLSDTSRWGTRIFDGRVSWNTARTAAATVFDTEVVELDDDFDDLVSATWVCTIPAAAVVMTSMVNGARGNGWHGGVIGNGYVAAIPNSGFGAIQAGSIQDFTLDGFSVQALSTSANGIGISTSSRGGNTVQGMIISGADAAFGTGVVLQGAMTIFAFNLITKIGSALSISLYTYGALVANNTIVGNKVKGIFCSSTSGTYGKYFNNISFGNTGENWQSGSLPSLDAASNNAGASGDTIWTKDGGSTITVASSDFTNYAGGDFRPASTLSALFDSGADYYGRLKFDLAGAEVPNYNNGDAEGIDIGCFEYDHGYGTHPSTANISVTGIVSGSRVLITKGSDDSVIYNDVPGTSLSLSTSFIGDFNVVIRKASSSPFYKEFLAAGTTVPNLTTTIRCLQQLDE